MAWRIVCRIPDRFIRNITLHNFPIWSVVPQGANSAVVEFYGELVFEARSLKPKRLSASSSTNLNYPKLFGHIVLFPQRPVLQPWYQAMCPH